ncbi:MAG: tRNA pseudouridine(55) synthase TruB [Betaproteobacteria bacterium]|nr:tRNA pseudouridine(55) synthase TruB [Betaproteobacteria bacterium]
MTNRLPRRRIDGVLLFHKPAGISSNGALQQVKRLFSAERAGHTGTLDPMASGLLPICFGEATKFAAELLDSEKRYRARVRLGERTDTGDAEGTVIERRQARVSRAQVIEALTRFRGDIEQVPPMYSAIKHQGRPLYDYARKGKEIERKPRLVRISAIELCGFEAGEALVELTCSKGTYVRVLAEDLGEALGCGAHLSGLVRTGVGQLRLEQAHTFEELAESDAGERCAWLLPVDSLLGNRPAITLADPLALRFTHGQVIQCGTAQAGRVRVYGPGEMFLGVATVETPGIVRPQRLMRQD